MSAEPKRRIRFGVRLLLLVVTLLASIFAWVNAVEQRRSAERAMERTNLETRLLLLEGSIASRRQRLKDQDYDETDIRAFLNGIESEIAATKQEIKALSP